MSPIQNPAAAPALVLHKSMGSGNQPAPLTVRAREGESRLVFASDPGGLVAEQYRVMRRRLVQKYPDGGTLLVTSPGPGDGKTLTSTNFAWCLAETGMPVLLAEMDLRNPSVDKLLGCSLEGPGIEAVLEDGADPRSVLRQVNRMQFYLATARRPYANPVELISGQALKNFLHWAKENHKWVVIDSPPLLTISDAIELSVLADCTLLVVRARLTPRILVERSIELLGPRLTQVVMNDGTACADSSHRYFNASYPYGAMKKKR